MEQSLLSSAHVSSHDTVQSPFTTVFRTLVGTTPRGYQRQRRGK